MYHTHIHTHTRKQINKQSLQRKQPEQTRRQAPSALFVKLDAHSCLRTLATRAFPLLANSPYLLRAPFLLLLPMVVNRHLQEVLFTADEAHRASHPSKARAHTSKPIQRLPALSALVLSRHCCCCRRANYCFIPLKRTVNRRSLCGITVRCLGRGEVSRSLSHLFSPARAD